MSVFTNSASRSKEEAQAYTGAVLGLVGDAEPFEGHYEPLIECGQRVRAGDVVGLLHDFDHIDRDPWPAAAGVDGVVIAQAWVAPIKRGQHIVVTGRIIG